MQPLSLSFTYDPGASKEVSGVLYFSNLPSLYESLVLGKALPLTLVTRELSLPALFAGCFFLHRETLLSPLALPFAYGLDLVVREGLPVMVHLPPLPYLALPDPTSSKAKVTQGLIEAVGTLKDYLVPEAKPFPPSVVDRGSNGFVVAKGTTPLDLYALGFLRGVIFNPSSVVIFKKSRHVPLSLKQARGYLTAMDPKASWVEDELTLVGNTGLPFNQVVQALLYC